MYRPSDTRRSSALGQVGGNCPQTLASSPNIFDKASKHQHIGAKRSILWLAKYAKMHLQLGLCPGPR